MRHAIHLECLREIAQRLVSSDRDRIAAVDISRRKLRALRRAVKATAFELPVTLHVLDEAQHRAAIQRTARQVGLVFFASGLAVVAFYAALMSLKPNLPNHFGPVALVGFAVALGVLGYGIGLGIAALNHPKDRALAETVASLFGRAEGFELRMRNGEAHEVLWADVQLVSFNIYVTQYGPFFQKALLNVPIAGGETVGLSVDPMLWDNGPALTAYVSDRILHGLGQIDEDDLPE